MAADEARATQGVVEVAGEEARALLQRLITNDVETLAPRDARYAALLTPQGKIIVDFLVVSAPTPDQAERFLLDCPAPLAAELTKKLALYKLRAKVTVADQSATLGAAPLGQANAPGESGLLVYADPRSAGLGFRAIGPHDSLGTLRDDAVAETARRVDAGVPQGGIDFLYGDAFPHEANLDRLNGVDFRKGCYVGQEVVSRMQHRGTARKRVTGVSFEAALACGTELLAGDLPIGTMGSVAEGRGLAMIRTDRAADAQAAGTPITAAGHPVSVHLGPDPLGH